MKKIFSILFGLAFIAFLYYFFVKQSEFEVNFKAKTIPGDLIETLRIWNRSLDSSHIVKVDSFSSVNQILSVENRKYIYVWKFDAINDTLTKVNIQISEPDRRLINKLLIPFTNQRIETDANEIVKAFYDVLKVHLQITKVKLIGEVELDSSFCICSSLETPQIEKADGMMRDYSPLTSFIADFDLKVDGLPMVRINQWDHSLGQLKFDFCFPIIETDSLPLVDFVVYKKFNRTRALKAEYNGNYITSDRGWYELLNYAQKGGYKTIGLPIEYFHDNPNMGMNESEWKAEIYLPIKDD